MSKEKLIDLDQEQLGLLKAILKRHIPDKTVWAYGSRVTWKAGETSDLDLAVFDCDSMQIYDMKEALEESDLLISVDVMDWESIPEKFKENIRKKYVVLQEKQGLEGWREVTLGEICSDISYGYTTSARSEPIGPKFLRITDIVPHRINWENVPYCEISEKDKEKYKLEIGDIVIARTGATTGYNKIIKINSNAVFASYLIRYKINPSSAYPFYIGHILQSSYWRSFVEGVIGGSAQPGANAKQFASFVIFLPSLSEQRTIAEVLSSLDDKIDLLHRQNKTLEDVAQTLFQKWFVKKKYEKCEGKPLWYFGHVICGKTPSKKVHKYFGGDIPFIKIPDMHGNTFIFDATDTLTEEGKNSQSNKTLPPKSICVSCIATVGLVSMNAFESQTNQQINSIIPVKDEYRYYIYLYMKSSKDLLEAMASGGTATMNLNTGNFANIIVPTANEKLISEFDGIVKPLFENIFFNQSQIRTLEIIRDALLPKLIRGNIRVNHEY